ncbi:hypothetical protein BCR33DRAFT_711767, partial [Rhizoclosmatium globosum]
MAATMQTPPVQYRSLGSNGSNMFYGGQPLTQEQQSQIEELAQLKEQQALLSVLLAEVSALPLPKSRSPASATSPLPQKDRSDAESIKSSAIQVLPDETWTSEMVAEWVRAKGASEEIVKSFIEQDIDGTIFPTLSDGDLKTELKVTALGLRRKILQAIEKVRSYTA